MAVTMFYPASIYFNHQSNHLPAQIHTTRTIIMQNFVVLAFVLFVPSAVLAGTRQAHPGEEARALALFDKLCSGGRDGGIDGGIFIHCKHAIQPLTYQLSETIRGDLNAPKQVEQFIFVSPPALHYNHALRIQGSGGLEPKTTVYVQPAKTSHSYDAKIQVDEADHVKPELVFLSGSPTGSPGFGGASPARQQQFGQQGQQFGQLVFSSPPSSLNPSSNSGNHVVVSRN